MKTKQLLIAELAVLMGTSTLVKPALSAEKSHGTPAETVQKGDKPNIVLINMDNFGYGELGVYGGGTIRGGATPRIDKLASLNFNLQYQSFQDTTIVRSVNSSKRNFSGRVL